MTFGVNQPKPDRRMGIRALDHRKRLGYTDIDREIGKGGSPKEMLRKLREEKARRLEHQKYQYYTPNGKCAEFVEQVGNGKNFIVFFSAANGVGKTAAGANVVAHLVWGRDSKNEYFQHPLFHDFPYPKAGRIVTDPANIVNIVRSLKEWFPNDGWNSKKGTKSYESLWKAGEMEFEIMSYEQDAKEFEGPTLGWVWFDEPPPEAIFKACVARLRKGGFIFITATPLTGSAWMYDRFMTGDYDAEGLKEGEKLKRAVAYIEADVEAACIQHGTRGHLEHSHIEKIVAEYDESERQARIYGKFQHLVGTVFKKFNRMIHVIKPFPINLREYCVIEALDPHPRAPDAVMWVAVDRKGTKFVIDEVFEKCAYGTAELAERIKAKATNYRIVRRMADKSAFVEDQHTGSSLARTLSELGLTYAEGTKFRSAADRRIEDALAYVKGVDGTYIKAPELYVFDTCKRTIYEIEHYRWGEYTGKAAERRNPKEKPMDKDDHEIENLGRILFSEPQFVEYQPPRRVADDSYSGDPYDR